MTALTVSIKQCTCSLINFSQREDEEEIVQPTSLDKKLEEAAARKNLSVHNVKSILHVRNMYTFVLLFTCRL